MPGLILHQSNRLELLAEQFAGVYASGAVDSFVAEQVVVQNAGMARWLSLKVADKLGIAANLSFLFPAEYSWSLMRTVLGGLPESAPFSPGPLAWRILAELEKSGGEYADLETSLQNLDQQGIFQLAKQLERLFDQYLFYRPEWIEKWESGEDHRWQARLWRALRQSSPDARHWVNLQDAFLAALPEARSSLSARVSFFGIAELSPGYLRLLHASARYMDVHFFLMNPCRQYWGDIEPEKIKLAAAEDLAPYLEIGNPLLASLGRQGRDFVDLLEQENTEQQERFVEPDSDTLLTQIQKDILNLVDPAGEKEDGVVHMRRQDDSLQVHACHTPTREVEVLHDQLLAMLDHDGELQPSDIIVMMPSVDDYASAVEAVFRAAPQNIPFSIADRKMLDCTVTGQLFRQLLEAPDSRYEVNRILNLVEAKPIQQRFGLDEDAIERVRNWCKILRVRWSVDGDMRKEMGLQESDEHSWRAAIRRLLLGYMLDEDEMFHGVLPYREVEGAVATDLGRFVALLDKLFSLRRWHDLKLPVAKWFEQFATLLTDFFDPTGAPEDVQMIRDSLARITQHSQQAEYHSEIDFTLARKLALDALTVENGGNRFIAGGVTFCELAPMRSVPFKVVCLIGMDDEKFPHPARHVSFDLMSDHYRRGDRSQRLQERYLFLESLLAARDKLYISHVGQDVISNKELPPSVLISELLDYVRNTFGIEPESLVTRHPLQPFSHRYLKDEHLFTYSDFGTTNAPSLRSAPPFSGEVIDSESLERAHLDDLETFIVHPVRYFLTQSLGLAQFWTEDELEEREPFVLGQFEPADVRRALDRVSDEFEMERLRAQGLLPHGAAGEVVLEQQQAALERLRARLSEDDLLPQPLSVELGETMLTGVLEGVTKDGLLLVEYDKPYHHQALKFWLRHLAYQVAQAASGSDTAGVSRMIYPDGEMTLQPVDNARDQLAGLIDAWKQGRQRPIRFMRKSAYVWQQAIQGNGKSTPRQKAEGVWSGGYHPESADLAYKIAFRGIDNLFDDEFSHWAELIWGGFFEAGGRLP